MTICIAAVTGNKRVVAVTDKMLTLSAAMVTKYQVAENNKAIPLSKKVLGLFAGDVVQANEILSRAKNKIADTDDVNSAAEKLKEAFCDFRKQVIEDNLLIRFGLTWDIFVKSQSSLDPNLVAKIAEVLGQYRVDVQVIITGVDSTGPHIYAVGDPGTISCMDSIGYVCIGSGSQHAQLSLIEAKYHAGFDGEDSLMSLFEAKKRAEFDPGVGDLTDVLLIDGKVRRFTDEELKLLSDTYSMIQTEKQSIKHKHLSKLSGIVK
jgi:hypothetical protein